MRDTQPDPPVAIYLRAVELARLRLPSLRSLELRVEMSTLTEFDASWLGLPRAFTASVLIDDNMGELLPGARLRVLQGLQGLLQANDKLDLCFSPTPDEQLVLRGMRLAACALSVESLDLLHLPLARSLAIYFWAPPARVSWAALTRTACQITVMLVSSCAELEVLGCGVGIAPEFEAGWQLSVHLQRGKVSGLPGCSMEVSGDAVFVLSNAAAADWPAGENDMW